jgi:hypothetical protein
MRWPTFPTEHAVTMGPEIWVALAAMFVSGGAVGTAGTLLTQWLVRRFDGAPPPRDGDGRQVDALRAEISEMGRYLHDLDARLDFTERLLDGALAPAPARTSGSEPTGRDTQPGEPRPDV